MRTKKDLKDSPAHSMWMRGAGVNRIGEMPFILPLRFYLRALLPRWLGGRSVAMSIAHSGLYDPDEVADYLTIKASEASVRGQFDLANEYSELVWVVAPHRTRRVYSKDGQRRNVIPPQSFHSDGDA